MTLYGVTKRETLVSPEAVKERSWADEGRRRFEGEKPWSSILAVRFVSISIFIRRYFQHLLSPHPGPLPDRNDSVGVWWCRGLRLCFV